ncbi:tail fiber assembly protein [Xenorhabdus bovienii]|uniref:tail fiber assembly protein n=1 Tax=Xenorhabdus bovienii TaxID=40576 RepID=UPI0023B31E97|nr:tail fiber assembly protein [Xenorhabdus bovienii]MDE9528240.1 tail fiber assembly protein [Xenorhabdus bovienii]MDE9570432.1 tail fiber assembly protein [Xenorhabdus bovienii]
MYYYSAKMNGFYPVEMKQRYINAGSWPDEGIEVSESVFIEFAGQAPPVGKRRVAGADGLPAWGDIPPPTPEELQRGAEREKQYLMSQAGNHIAPLQYAVDLQMATNAEQTELTAWKKYCVLLNRVDCSAAPKIDWPKAPE